MTSFHQGLSLRGVYRLEVTGENGGTDHFADHFPDCCVMRLLLFLTAHHLLRKCSEVSLQLLAERLIPFLPI